MNTPINYLNLTNGIEALYSAVPSPRFIRIQSTALEQKRWGHVILDLDNDFILNAVIGNTCVVYDYSNKGADPRAIWQGLPWITHAIRTALGMPPAPAFVRGNKCTEYFDKCYAGVDEKAKTKLKYFRKFYTGCEIHIDGIGRKTVRDGDYAYYAETLNLFYKAAS